MAQQQSLDGAQGIPVSGIDGSIDITAEQQQSSATGPLAELFVHDSVHDSVDTNAVNDNLTHTSIDPLTHTSTDPGKPVSLALFGNV